MIYLALVLALVYAILILIGASLVYAVKLGRRLWRRTHEPPDATVPAENTCHWCGRARPETELVIGMGGELHCIDVADCFDHSHLNVVPLRRHG